MRTPCIFPPKSLQNWSWASEHVQVYIWISNNGTCAIHVHAIKLLHTILIRINYSLIAGLSLLALFYLEFHWFMTRVKCRWKRLCGKLAAGLLPCTGLGAHRDEDSEMPTGSPDPVHQRRLLMQKAWGPYNQGEWRHFLHIQHHHTGLIMPTIVSR